MHISKQHTGFVASGFLSLYSRQLLLRHTAQYRQVAHVGSPPTLRTKSDSSPVSKFPRRRPMVRSYGDARTSGHNGTPVLPALWRLLLRDSKRPGFQRRHPALSGSMIHSAAPKALRPGESRHVVFGGAVPAARDPMEEALSTRETGNRPSA